MDRDGDANCQVFALLIALCCLTHFSTHLGPARLGSPTWWLAVGIIVAAAALLHRFTLARFLVLIGLQVLHVVLDAPFNPDHWLLQFFVNLTILLSALGLWLKGGRVAGGDLFRQFAPAARLIFLICYGFAAFCKYNSQFLNAATSCATEFTYIQIQVSPWLAYVTWPDAAGWTTVLCESAVPLLLLFPRTRKAGIMLALVFHTVLVLSPAIAVFDFTVTIYTMVFLFAPPNAGAHLRRQLDELKSRTPALWQLFRRLKTPALVLIAAFMIGRSASGYALYGDERVGRIAWLIDLTIAAAVIWRAAKVLFGEPGVETVRLAYRPVQAGHYFVILVALLNCLCPYVGLKTQGSFTMFSNLRTEAGHWNHLVMPRAVRFIGRFQDDLVQVIDTSDRRLRQDYLGADQSLLVPTFEVRRAALDPTMSITYLRDGEEQTVCPASLDPLFGDRPSWLLRKLLIFRPVTHDGSAYCGN